MVIYVITRSHGSVCCKDGYRSIRPGVDPPRVDLPHVRPTLNLFSVNIHVHQKPSSAIFREGIRLGLVFRVRVSFR